MNLLPPIEQLRNTILEIFRRQAEAVECVGGNLLIHIPEVATWTILTRGPRKGLFDEATEDEVQFALIAEEWVMLELLDSSPELDLETWAAKGYFRMEGDFRVYERFMALAERKDLLSVRGSSSATPSAERRASRKRPFHRA